MTNEEAIERLEKMNVVTDELYRTALALSMGKKALEKQIAKMPTGISETWEGRVANCPDCKKFIREESSTNGCFYCLQKLDWNKTEEFKNEV